MVIDGRGKQRAEQLTDVDDGGGQGKEGRRDGVAAIRLQRAVDVDCMPCMPV